MNEKDGNSYLNWDLVIKNLSELINYTEIHFIKLSENEINNVINTNNYNNLNIYNNTVYDVAYNKNSNVKMWTTISNDGYHIMYVATPCDVLYFTNASSMFSDMITLKKISFGDNGLVIDTSKVKDMSEMFNQCESLTSLDLSSFDTSKVEDMFGMFSYCRQLTSLDLSKFTFDSVIDYGVLNVPSNIPIYVKDEKAKEWVLNNETSDLPESNIIIKK